jgi:hypothetical protein
LGRRVIDLTGEVRRVDPFGITRVLGPRRRGAARARHGRADRPAGGARALGHGYRVEARIVVWQQDDALRVPASALFRTGDAKFWAGWSRATGSSSILRPRSRTARQSHSARWNSRCRPVQTNVERQEGKRLLHGRKQFKNRFKRQNRIENMFGRLKDWVQSSTRTGGVDDLSVSTRYDRCPRGFLSAIALAAIGICWLRVLTPKH